MERLPRSIQLIGNSATVNKYTIEVMEKARSKVLDAPCNSEIQFVSMPPEDVLRNRITHWAIFAQQRDKIDTLRRFINAENPKKLIVFTSRNDQVENIVSKLGYKNIDCSGLNAKIDKIERKSTIDRFRSGKLPILVTSDLTARGLDIPNITHVVQLDLPEKKDFFIHRAGRTARAGKTGINCVIGDELEMRRYANFEKNLKIIVYPKIIYKGALLAPGTY